MARTKRRNPRLATAGSENRVLCRNGSEANLIRHETQVAPHLRPIFRAACVGDLRLVAVCQGAGEFHLSQEIIGRLLLVADDFETAHGPAGFHRESLEVAFEGAQAVAVIACAPLPRVYRRAAEMASTGGTVILVETQPGRGELEWVAFARQHAPHAPLLLGTVKGTVQ